MKILIGKIFKYLELPLLAMQLPSGKIIECAFNHEDEPFHAFYIEGEHLIDLKKIIEEEIEDAKSRQTESHME